MSLRELCKQHEVNIERQTVTASDAMGSQKAYTANARGIRPRTSRCRIVELSARERETYAVRGMDATHNVYFEEADPEVDEQDRMYQAECSGVTPTADRLYLYVTGVRNPDRLGRYWIVTCAESKGNKPR